MCGIVGIYNLNGEPVSQQLIKQMCDTIAHRGPNDEGQYIDGNLGLGNRRLSIIDLSPVGHQPMSNEDETVVITYNGEVYNFQEIRKELELSGHVFRSRTDTEVIIHAYEQWGEDCVLKFNGMFAFAIWDQRKRRLFLARDKYGIKPLYYYHKDNFFIFASEIKAILEHPNLSVSVCLEALNEYFTFQNIFSDLTLFEGVRLLSPAHTLVLDGNSGSLNIRRYWDYEFNQNYQNQTAKELEDELYYLFEQAIRRQLIGDVPVGCYLSGGMDSGSITAVAARHIPYLATFTAGFDLSSASGLELAFDEREKAEQMSHLFKTEHYEVVLKAGDMERVMEPLIWHLEDLRVGQCYPNYYVTRLASKFVKVILSGTGGDELFGGYPWRYYRAVVNSSKDNYLRKYYNYWQRLLPDDQREDFYLPDVRQKIKHYSPFEVFCSVFDHQDFSLASPEDYINKSMYFEIKTFLHGLFIVEDKISMAHSMETRVPFMDDDLVAFATKIPVRYKLMNLDEIIRIDENEPQKLQKYYQRTKDGKVILRQAMSRLLPESITDQLKQGFSAPDASWFRGESIDYIRSLLLNKNAKIFDFLQYAHVKKIIDEHSEGKVNHRLMIWSLLSFEWWLKIFIGNRQ